MIDEQKLNLWFKQYNLEIRIKLLSLEILFNVETVSKNKNPQIASAIDFTLNCTHCTVTAVKGRLTYPRTFRDGHVLRQEDIFLLGHFNNFEFMMGNIFHSIHNS